MWTSQAVPKVHHTLQGAPRSKWLQYNINIDVLVRETPSTSPQCTPFSHFQMLSGKSKNPGWQQVNEREFCSVTIQRKEQIQHYNVILVLSATAELENAACSHGKLQQMTRLDPLRLLSLHRTPHKGLEAMVLLFILLLCLCCPHCHPCLEQPLSPAGTKSFTHTSFLLDFRGQAGLWTSRLSS